MLKFAAKRHFDLTINMNRFSLVMNNGSGIECYVDKGSRIHSVYSVAGINVTLGLWRLSYDNPVLLISETDQPSR